jgi:hypothetical protein
MLCFFPGDTLFAQWVHRRPQSKPPPWPGRIDATATRTHPWQTRVYLADKGLDEAGPIVSSFPRAMLQHCGCQHSRSRAWTGVYSGSTSLRGLCSAFLAIMEYHICRSSTNGHPGRLLIGWRDGKGIRQFRQNFIDLPHHRSLDGNIHGEVGQSVLNTICLINLK